MRDVENSQDGKVSTTLKEESICCNQKRNPKETLCHEGKKENNMYLLHVTIALCASLKIS